MPPPQKPEKQPEQQRELKPERKLESGPDHKPEQGTADNRLIIAGTVVRAPETRYSPAGIPISRFALEHQSRQVEAGMPRDAVCRMMVIAAGEALHSTVSVLALGSRVRVSGFLSRADHRTGEDRLVLHAQAIDIA